MPASETCKPQYWAFRVDRRHLSVLDKELEDGRLRQGWGWDPRQNLKQLTLNEGARRNMRMLQVRKGDRILIPHLPNYGQVSIVEATEDWREGYRFAVLEGIGEFGHIFPAKRIKHFKSNNAKIPASLRSTFRNPCRFWRIDDLGSDIESVIQVPDAELVSSSNHVDRWKEKIVEVVAEKVLSDAFHDAAVRFNSKAEWEWILVDALQRLNPAWDVRRTGGKEEVNHGADILVTTRDIFRDGCLGIAIQVKDYKDVVGEAPLDQIRKAIGYWEEGDIWIVQLVLVLIGARKEDNPKLVEAAQTKGFPVRVIWTEEVKDMIYRSACHYLSECDD